MKNEPNEKLCSHEQIKHFYDRLGGWLDTQRFFKAPALKSLIEYSDFEHARHVYELGCGTGRLAEKILLSNSELTYQGTDLSSTMVKLTQERLHRFSDRATVVLADSTVGIELPNGVADRFVSTYVFDLMSALEIQALLAEAHRILGEEGKLCLVSLTNSRQLFGRILTLMWSRVHQINPVLMGGCRPIELTELVGQTEWRMLHVSQASRFGLTSEVLVAEKRIEKS